jgi:hypothetical protein
MPLNPSAYASRKREPRKQARKKTRKANYDNREHHRELRVRGDFFWEQLDDWPGRFVRKANHFTQHFGDQHHRQQYE